MTTFYLSSTFEDLKACREMVSAEFQKKPDHKVVGMENNTASRTAPLKKCLADVAGCDAYIGIFAWRYGYVPKDDNPEHKSITELEYLKAVEQGKGILIFILSEEAHWQPVHVDRDRERIVKLRDELSNNHTVEFFKDCEELTRKVMHAVWEYCTSAERRDETSRGRGVAGETEKAREEGGTSEAAANSQRIPPPPAVFRGVDPTVSPYVGPTSFPKHKWNKFFGREREAKELVELIVQSRVVLVYAASGAGKSSLLNTLVFKSLEERGYDVLLDARVGGMPRETLKTGGADDIQNIYSFYAVYALKNIPPDSSVCLADYLRSTPSRPGTKGRVLVFDQFEELFTQHGDRHEDREGFIDDLVNALLNDPTLRLVFAMRQEYLAEIYQLAEQFPADLKMRYFLLPRMKESQALEAIKRPAEKFARFASGVAEKILGQLYTVKVLRSDGTVILKRAPCIEMLHLQIVCDRLWAKLPSRITEIEEEHIEHAIREGQTFDEFFDNILDDFYDSTVREVSNSDETHVRGGYSEELIRLGCMKFVTPASTRAMVKRTDDRVGRLPYYIVRQLVERHLLRSENRGDDQWFELAHDRLVKPIGRRNDRKFSALIYASDVLDKMLEQAVVENGGHLKGYFEPHPDILKEWEPFRDKAMLFKDEMDFLFRASLASDQKTDEWYEKAKNIDYPELRVEVLREALHDKSFEVSQNAAILVGKDKIKELSSQLVRLALSDAMPDVRREATFSLVRLDDPKLYGELIKKLNEPKTRAKALTALAHTRVAADSESAPEFEKVFSQRLSLGECVRIWWSARVIRFREEWPAILFVGLLAGVFGAISAPLFKWLPGLFGFAPTQAQPSLGMGVFQGLTAGFIWAGAIVLGLTLHDRVFARKHGPKKFLRPLGSIVSGVVGGLLGSLVIVFIVLLVFNDKSLVAMGWIHPEVDASLWNKIEGILGIADTHSRSDITDTRTHFGYVHLITGAGLGVGMAWMTNGLRASTRWTDFIKEYKGKLFRLRQTKETVFRITGIARPHVLPLLFMLTVAGAAASYVPNVPQTQNKYIINIADGSPEFVKKISRYSSSEPDIRGVKPGVILGVAGDCMSQAIGGFFAIVGMGLGIIIVSYGFEFRPHKKRF